MGPVLTAQADLASFPCRPLPSFLSLAAQSTGRGPGNEAKAVQHKCGPIFDCPHWLIDPPFDFVYTDLVLNQVDQLIICLNSL